MAEVELSLSCGAIDRQGIWLLFKDLLAFALYMHHQMPWTLDQLQTEISNMEEERARNSKNTLQKVKNLQRFVKAMDTFMSSVEKAILTAPELSGLMVILGSTVSRPQVVYKLQLDSQSTPSSSAKVNTKNLSRKMIRELIASDVIQPLPGPTKAFVFIEGPAGFAQTEHFLPKRGFTYKKSKAIEISIHLLQNKNIEPENGVTEDIIWFQCRQYIKGLSASKVM